MKELKHIDDFHVGLVFERNYYYKIKPDDYEQTFSKAKIRNEDHLELIKYFLNQTLYNVNFRTIE